MKVVLLHNGNVLLSVPVAHSKTQENYIIVMQEASDALSNLQTVTLFQSIRSL